MLFAFLMVPPGTTAKLLLRLAQTKHMIFITFFLGNSMSLMLVTFYNPSIFKRNFHFFFFFIRLRRCWPVIIIFFNNIILHLLFICRWNSLIRRFLGCFFRCTTVTRCFVWVCKFWRHFKLFVIITAGRIFIIFL